MYNDKLKMAKNYNDVGIINLLCNSHYSEQKHTKGS